MYDANFFEKKHEVDQLLQKNLFFQNFFKRRNNIIHMFWRIKKIKKINKIKKKLKKLKKNKKIKKK